MEVNQKTMIKIEKEDIFGNRPAEFITHQFAGYDYEFTIEFVQKVLDKLKLLAANDDSKTIRDFLGRQKPL